MNWRWIAGVVCALYLSVGAVFSATHDHSGDALHTDQCAACAWHHLAVDVPEIGPPLHTPEGVLLPEQIIPLSFHYVSLGIHPSRGPPSFLL